MNHEKTFGAFIVLKRRQVEMTAKELAKLSGISAVYLCEIEKGIKTTISEVVSVNLRRALLLNEIDTEIFYDLLARAKNSVSEDLLGYIMNNDIIRTALRTAMKKHVPNKCWEDFVIRIDSSANECCHAQ